MPFLLPDNAPLVTSFICREAHLCTVHRYVAQFAISTPIFRGTSSYSSWGHTSAGMSGSYSTEVNMSQKRKPQTLEQKINQGVAKHQFTLDDWQTNPDVHLTCNFCEASLLVDY